MPRLFAVPLVALTLLASACGSTDEYMKGARTNLPVPAVRIDIRASRVELRIDKPQAFAEEIRSEVAKGLEEALNLGPRQPARFRLRAGACKSSAAMGMYWIVLFPTVAPPPLLGIPTNWHKCDIDLDLQVGKQFFSGHGTGFATEGVYYNTGGVKVAIARGIKKALENLQVMEAGGAQ
jgi:hypothetical protein